MESQGRGEAIWCLWFERMKTGEGDEFVEEEGRRVCKSGERY